MNEGDESGVGRGTTQQSAGPTPGKEFSVGDQGVPLSFDDEINRGSRTEGSVVLMKQKK